MMQNMRNYMAGAGVAFLFGISFLVVKQALNVFSQPAMLACRFTLSAAVLWILAGIGILSVHLKGKPWKRVVLLSLFYPVLSFALEAKGVSLVTSSQAGIIMSLSPVFAVILGTIFLKERSTLLQAFMVLLSVIGVVLITVSAAEAEMGGSVKGVLTMLCCACLVAVQTVTVHHLSDEFSSIEITCIMNVTAAVCFDAYAVFSLRERIWDELFVPFGSSEGLLPIVFLGLGCSVGAFFCLNYINSHLDVVRAAVFINLSTIVSVLAGVLIGGDRLNAGQTAGILMILICVWGVNAFQPSGQKTLICHRNDRGDQ